MPRPTHLEFNADNRLHVYKAGVRAGLDWFEMDLRASPPNFVEIREWGGSAWRNFLDTCTPRPGEEFRQDFLDGFELAMETLDGQLASYDWDDDRDEMERRREEELEAKDAADKAWYYGTRG